MNSTPDIQTQKAFYDEYWDGLKPLSSYKVQRVKWLADVLLQLRKSWKGKGIQLLDLGCGDGRLCPFWKELTGAEVYGLELSPKAVENAQHRYKFINYKQGDATQTGYDKNMFDVVICQEVIEHIEDQKDLINECSRILKTGGYLVLTTPNKYYFDRRKGGNYSKQPIENIIDKATLVQLLASDFKLHSYETLIYAKGDYGIYKRITNRYWLAILRRLGLEETWKQRLLKKGYGLHHAIVSVKS